MATIAFMSFLVVGASGSAEAAAPASPPAKARYEMLFMEMMVMHHHMAVMMGEVCTERTDIHRELRQLCRGIVASQTREITKMQTWLHDWYGIDYDPMAGMDPVAMEADMARLRAMPSAEFEQAFLDEMIMHHQAALQPARECERRAAHPALQNLCGQILQAQVPEIQLMHHYLCVWYDRCRSSSGTPTAA